MLRALAMGSALGAIAMGAAAEESAAPGAWEHVGPHNIFDAYNENGTGPLPMGEAGTLASAASPKANPLLIYAGGQNNGVSSGVIKTIDGGRHWTRNSKGLWDTRILGVWIHPDDPKGGHVLAGTHSGICTCTASHRAQLPLCIFFPEALPLCVPLKEAAAQTSRTTSRRAGRSATRPKTGARR